jgi:predicted RecB family nuclease
MPTESRVLAELVAMEPSDIEAELEQVRGEAARLQMQEQLLAQALRMHQFAKTGPPDAERAVRDLAARAPAAREQNISANVLTIVRQAAGEDLTPAEVQEILADFSIHADLSVIRQALRRWAERHMIIKSGHRYRALAADQIKRA